MVAHSQPLLEWESGLIENERWSSPSWIGWFFLCEILETAGNMFLVKNPLGVTEHIFSSFLPLVLLRCDKHVKLSHSLPLAFLPFCDCLALAK